MKVNTGLSYKGCREMVFRIQNGDTPAEIRRRCKIAMEWLDDNTVITNEQYNELMMDVSYWMRESYHMD